MSGKEIENLGVHELLLLQSAAAKVIKPEVDATRALSAAELNPGDRKTIYINGIDCGYVLKTKETPIAAVTDESQFLAYADEQGAAVLGWRMRPGKRVEDALAAFAEFDPALAAEFCEQVPAVSDSYRKALLTEAERGVDVPGVEVSRRSPQTKAFPNELALPLARALVSGASMPQLGGAE